MPCLKVRMLESRYLLSNFTVDLSFLQCNQVSTRLSGESGCPHTAHAHSTFVPHVARTLQPTVQTGNLDCLDYPEHAISSSCMHISHIIHA